MTSALDENSRGSFGGNAASLGAVVLILLGIVFQLGEFSYGHSHTGCLWIFSMIASGLWSLLAACTSVPGMQEALRFWPLFLVALGCAILLLRDRRKPAPSPSDRGEYGG